MRVPRHGVDVRAPIGVALQLVLLLSGFVGCSNSRTATSATLNTSNHPTSAAASPALAERVRIANESHATLFVSLHSNGAADVTQRGVEVYYDSRRPFGASSEQFAHAVLQSVIAAAAGDGYALRDRGIIDAKCWRSFQGRCVGLYVLSPEGTTALNGQPVTKRATEMPGMLVELLFLSNPEDSALLHSDAARESVARGVAQGILAALGARAQAP